MFWAAVFSLAILGVFGLGIGAGFVLHDWMHYREWP